MAPFHGASLGLATIRAAILKIAAAGPRLRAARRGLEGEEAHQQEGEREIEEKHLSAIETFLFPTPIHCSSGTVQRPLIAILEDIATFSRITPRACDSTHHLHQSSLQRTNLTVKHSIRLVGLRHGSIARSRRSSIRAEAHIQDSSAEAREKSTATG